MFLLRTLYNVEIVQIVKYSLLMMRDSTICEGGSTFDFLFLGKMSFSLSRYLGFFFFFIVVIPDCFVSLYVYAVGIVLFWYQWGRVRAHSLRFFFFVLFLSISCFFFAQKEEEEEKKKKKKQCDIQRVDDNKKIRRRESRLVEV